MSLTDIDKSSDRRNQPSLNTGDILAQGALKAHATEGIAYRTEDSTTTARVTTSDDHISVFDDANDERITIGRLPDGTYGIVITKEGSDINDVVS